MAQELVKNATQFARQASKLLSTFNVTTDHKDTARCCGYSHIPTRAACVINLHDRWADFNRGLLTQSAVGGWSTRASTTLSRASTCLLYTSDAADDLLCVDLG